MTDAERERFKRELTVVVFCRRLEGRGQYQPPEEYQADAAVRVLAAFKARYAPTLDDWIARATEYLTAEAAVGEAQRIRADEKLIADLDATAEQAYKELRRAPRPADDVLRRYEELCYDAGREADLARKAEAK